MPPAERGRKAGEQAEQPATPTAARSEFEFGLSLRADKVIIHLDPADQGLMAWWWVQGMG